VILVTDFVQLQLKLIECVSLTDTVTYIFQLILIFDRMHLY